MAWNIRVKWLNIPNLFLYLSIKKSVYKKYDNCLCYYEQSLNIVNFKKIPYHFIHRKEKRKQCCKWIVKKKYCLKECQTR